jgi:signal transduction histidine kinase/CheY-like chemotaxis protein
VEDGKVVRVITVVRGTTEVVRAQERLRQAEKMEALGQLAGGIAHDFNNQLAAILGYAELLRARLTDPGLREDADMIGRAASRSADLTRQLLAFARKGKVLSETIDVHAVLREIVALLGRTVDKRIRIRMELDDVACLTTGDPSQLHTALLNLAINARDAMPEGGELVFRTSRLSLSDERSRAHHLAPGAYVQIAVSDTGVGMNEATRRRLFEPFFTTKEPGKGTGMGLAAVYGTVLGHQGAIAVQSEPGKGSTFTVLLPLSTTGQAGARPAVDVPADNIARNVLVVDDEPAVRSMIRDALEDLGWSVTAYADSRQAVRWYAEHGASIDLVILDMAMPLLNGADTLKALRAINPAVRAVIASGHAETSLAGAAVL